MIRRLKLIYALYNLFHKNQLQHNLALYRKLGLRKQYFSPVSSIDFEDKDDNILFDQSTIEEVNQTRIFESLTEASKQSILDFEDNGYCIIKNYLDQDRIASVNDEIDALIKSGRLKYKYGNKLMFSIHKSAYLKRLWENSNLIELLSCLIKGEAKLFQSINFLTGSQQKTHSDSIHMTTFPLGGLLGVWLALEDIEYDNGPLHYYPKSHKLPYYLNRDYDNVGTKYFLGKNGYKAYEKMLEKKILEKGIEKKVFTAGKGDLFIWHANLLHGGEPHLNKEKTRKSMVLHYFDINRICYHEITQRPALMNKGI